MGLAAVLSWILLLIGADWWGLRLVLALFFSVVAARSFATVIVARSRHR